MLRELAQAAIALAAIALLALRTYRLIVDYRR
jgi:hypothetical protein